MSECDEPHCNGRDFDREKSMLKEYGFFSHMIIDDPDTTTRANFHTHGIPQSLNHPDIQIIWALPPDIYGSIIHSVYKFIKNGNKLKTHRQYHNQFLNNMPVEFIWAIENDRDILRMILPDTVGRTSLGEIAMPYAAQWLNTSHVQLLGILEVESWND